MVASKRLLGLLKPGSSEGISFGSLAILLRRMSLSRWVRYLADEKKDRLKLWLRGLSCLASRPFLSISANENLIVIRMKREAFYRHPKTSGGSINGRIKYAVETITGLPFPRMKEAAYVVWSRHGSVLPHGTSIINADLMDKRTANHEAGLLWSWIEHVLDNPGDEVEFEKWIKGKRFHLPGQYERDLPPSSSRRMASP